MVTLLKKIGKGVDACLIGTDDISEATHFLRNEGSEEEDGTQYPISQLTQNDRNDLVTNKLETGARNHIGTQTNEEPLLVMSVVGQEEQKDKTVDNALDLPAMDFSTTKHTEDQTELEMHRAGQAAEEKVLEDAKW